MFIFNFFKRLKGSHYRKFLKSCDPIVLRINELERSYQSLTDDQLQAKTAEFKQRIKDGEHVDMLLPEAFAVVKNASRRLVGKKFDVCDHALTWDMVHYDVQLIGGIALHQKKIAEMATGEGKTLVAACPLYLNALTGKNCQLVTVNDYLARRDSEWMGYLYRFLGLSIGCIQSGMDPSTRAQAYGCDITYGTSSEFGFDYLRDNGMATRKEDQVQRDHYFCIVDEVDSILVDEARTPLIISGPTQDETEAPFREMNPGVQRFVALQQKLCNELAAEAKAGYESDKANWPEAATKLLQVKLGMPKNKQLMRLMEDPAVRRHFEAYDVEMHGDMNRASLFNLKENLYFTIDEKQHESDLTEKGRQTLRPDNPDAFVMMDLPTIFSEIDSREDLTPEQRVQSKQAAEAQFAKQSEDIHCISQLLRAYCLYERDIEYVVQDGKVVIIDVNTGRAMQGRRWSEGLHQAVEAKEHVAIEKETKTYATITIQNYFRMYEKLSGMTGTAETEAQEFYDIYNLSVVTIPTNKPCIRKDLNDVIFKTRREKYNAAVREIKEAHGRGQPILVGTTSVEASEILSKMLKNAKITHSVLNAKYHEQEADIVARAGQRGAVTIATNMAGRGTDIKLGEGVAALGGLAVLGTERHESRRTDRQLRGRCSRQGDPGTSRFLVSLEDDLMRLFANAGPISKILEKTFSEGDELEHPLLNRSIESAQKKVEQQNYSIRKRLLQFDDVLNKQREVIYGLRNDAILMDAPKDLIIEMLDEELDFRLEDVLASHRGNPEGEATLQFIKWLNAYFPVSLKIEEVKGIPADGLKQFLLDRVLQAYAEKESIETPEEIKGLERYTVITAIDKQWQDHLTEMEDLRRSVGLRAYGQKDPLSEYKSGAYVFFEELMRQVRSQICINLFRSATNLKKFEQMLERISSRARTTGPTSPQQAVGSSAAPGAPGRSLPKIPAQRVEPRVGRNDACPCGSGKKYKKCCGVVNV